ncbi:MAG: DUF2817 domain-containing protein [Bdellovibrionales bacterium]|nr:DUF2817 domain-containing protein [Bdellovibrionales bacterium]
MARIFSLRKGHFPEMEELESLCQEYSSLLRVDQVGEAEHKGQCFPLKVIEMGVKDPSAPVFGIFGGVHGLERIGTHVVLVYMRHLLQSLQWDKTLQARLEESRFVFMPIVNPVGMFHFRRSNANGVDLMRNAPVEGESPSTQFFGGHRISPKLPCYRGTLGKMEVEAEALCQVVREKLFPSRLAFVLDVHSGFGSRDRFWFPWAKSLEMFPMVSEVMAFRELLDRSYPYHVYDIEPSASHYVIHGDLWDYLFAEHYETLKATGAVFLPWTLELGSWAWLRKSPLQILHPLRFHHPLKPHRIRRILRRHMLLFDFVHRSLISPDSWLGESQTRREEFESRAKELWYERG